MAYASENGAFVPTDWLKIVFSPVLWVPLGTTLSAFWIMANNSWMQAGRAPLVRDLHGIFP